jgi:pimeloyl-ACP methyl ester carboxylesterase
MARTYEIMAADGRPLHAYDSGDGDAVVIWHHGTPQTGELPAALVRALADRRLRGISYDRPGYGGSAPDRGRDVAAAAADVAAIADALDIEEFAAIGASGGGPHALACAALLPGRVTAAVCLAGLAPFGADGLDWFAGMASAGAAELQAAVRGRAALETLLRSTDFDDTVFTPADHAALAGDWRSLGAIAEKATANGLDGMVDDDVAYVTPWGFDPSDITAPVLLVHGEDDRVVPSTHSQWLGHRLATAVLWLRPGDGHISVLDSCAASLDWLIAHRGSSGHRR